MSMLVAQTSRISTFSAFSEPTRSTSLLCSARSSFAWRCRGMFPISSRNSVPPSAWENFPAWSLRASVNAPLTWPKSSLSKSVSLRAPTSTHTRGPPLRELLACTCLASSSLPVPFSPVISTLASVGAILSTVRRSSSIAADEPQNIS